MAFWGWQPYVPVAERRARAQREMDKLRKKGQDIQPVNLAGRTIARSFWGKGWCDHLESFSDYINRLPRGRTYVRNGSVCHLDIRPGRVEAIVSGSELYRIVIRITELKAATWTSIKDKCAGHIGSMLELLQGKLSGQVMAIVTNRLNGLFPQPGEMTLDCSCPDWATMCKHVAAVLYGVGSRLDSRPELLFLLRGVDAQELIATEIALPGAAAGIAGDTLADDQLGAIFGIDLDTETDARPVPQAQRQKQPRATRRVAATRKQHGRQRPPRRAAKPPPRHLRGAPHRLPLKGHAGSHPPNPQLPLYARRPRLPPPPHQRFARPAHWSPDCADSRDCPSPNSPRNLAFHRRPCTVGKPPGERSTCKPVC